MTRNVKPRTAGAMALIAWLGVLAVIAILMAFLLPALLREIDFNVARAETATLKTLGNVLQSAIQHNSSIPAHTNWAEFVSAETGMDTGSITNNARHQPRILLIDTNGWFSTVGLPYTQTYTGTTNVPLNARMMIATSLGKPLPISGGPLSASSFANLWNAAEGTLPANAPWTTWTGRPDDVKLERINLMPLFVTLYLSTYASATNGLYSIGTDSSRYPAPNSSPQSPLLPHYYLVGTSLRLYNVATNGNFSLDSTQILIRDGSFMYVDNVWKSSAAGGVMPGGVDISGIVSAFLNAVPNTLRCFRSGPARWTGLEAEAARDAEWKPIPGRAGSRARGTVVQATDYASGLQPGRGPIRRYPDLLVHRQLGRCFDGHVEAARAEAEALEAASVQSSQCEREAMEAERAMLDLKKAEFTLSHLLEPEPGTVVSVVSFGFFVELDAFPVEGLVRADSLTDDRYYFIEAERALKGMRTKRRFRLGDRVLVEATNVSLRRREIDFALLKRLDGGAADRSVVDPSQKQRDTKRPRRAGRKSRTR